MQLQADQARSIRHAPAEQQDMQGRPEITDRNAAAISSSSSAASAMPRSCGLVSVIMYTSLPRLIHSAANSLISMDRAVADLGRAHRARMDGPARLHAAPVGHAIPGGDLRARGISVPRLSPATVMTPLECRHVIQHLAQPVPLTTALTAFALLRLGAETLSALDRDERT
jgi:hypothetical protein